MSGEPVSLDSGLQVNLNFAFRSAMTTFDSPPLYFSSFVTSQAVIVVLCIVTALFFRRTQSRCSVQTDQTAPTDFQEALYVALQSALSKFDSLSVLFSKGMTFPEVVTMLVDEIRSDKDFANFLVDDFRQKALDQFVKQHVGPAFGAWKKDKKEHTQENASGRPESSFLSWPSIENYPEWVHAQIHEYKHSTHSSYSSNKEKALARAKLEKALLDTPLWSASTKYDGTCFGKMDTGVYVGRRHVVGASQTYQQTSTHAAKDCDVEKLKEKLCTMLRIQLESGSVCVWGELMCNPGYYDYSSRGLADAWIIMDSFRCSLSSATGCSPWVNTRPFGAARLGIQSYFKQHVSPDNVPFSQTTATTSGQVRCCGGIIQRQSDTCRGSNTRRQRLDGRLQRGSLGEDLRKGFRNLEIYLDTLWTMDIIV